MKKIIAIVMTLAFVMLLGACGAKEPSAETTTTAGLEETNSTSASADETASEEEKLLEELLTAEWIGLGDEAYKNVVNYIKNNTEDSNWYDVKLCWELEDYTLKLNNSTRTLSLSKDGYGKVLCENVDFPNIHGAGDNFTIIDNVSFHETGKSIEVWNWGEKLGEVRLPSSENEILGTIQNGSAKEIFVRSNNTIGVITWNEDNKFQYNEIISDCAGPAEKESGSLWYLNKDANLVHVNLFTKEMQTIAKNVTSLVDVHDGTYSVGWREKGSLEWHVPEFCIMENGEKTPWSERGGM